MGSRRLSFSLILGIVATPILAAPMATDGSEKRPESTIKASGSSAHTQQYYSPLVDLLAPSPWDLNVPGGLGDMEHVLYLRSPRAADLHENDEILEPAEQILFRPLFRHRQLIAERFQRLKDKEALRRRIFNGEPGQQFSTENANGLEDRVFNIRQKRSAQPLVYRKLENPKYYFEQEFENQ